MLAPLATSLNLALVGTPNSGKTSLFNALTGSRQRAANYPGVTVERNPARSRPRPGRQRPCDAPSRHAESTGNRPCSIAAVSSPSSTEACSASQSTMLTIVAIQRPLQDEISREPVATGVQKPITAQRIPEPPLEVRPVADMAEAPVGRESIDERRHLVREGR